MLAGEKSVRACGAVAGVVKTSSSSAAAVAAAAVGVVGCGFPVVDGVGKAISACERFVGVASASVLTALRGGEDGGGGIMRLRDGERRSSLSASASLGGQS